MKFKYEGVELRLTLNHDVLILKDGNEYEISEADFMDISKTFLKDRFKAVGIKKIEKIEKKNNKKIKVMQDD